MVVISKQLFYEKLDKSVKCSELHYWNENCLQSIPWFVRTTFWGSFKFFLPIYVIKAILNHKKLRTKGYLKQILLEELRSSLYGTLLANLFLSGNCVLSKLTGRLHYYNLGLISGLISGLGILVETKENKMLDTLIFFNLLIQAGFSNVNAFKTIILGNTRQTLLFIGVSSLLMHLLQNRKENLKYTNFWFFMPPKFPNPIEHDSKKESRCSHKEDCTKHVLKGIRRYFLLGFAFSIVKKLIPNMFILFRKPLKLYGILINKDNFRFGAFIGAYVGVYRGVICKLVKTQIIDQKHFGAIAGIISGMTFLIYPNMQILSVGVTTILQIIYNELLKKLKIGNEIPQLLIYMMSHALLLHSVVLCKESSPAYYVNMLEVASNNMFFKLYDNVVAKYIL